MFSPNRQTKWPWIVTLAAGLVAAAVAAPNPRRKGQPSRAIFIGVPGYAAVRVFGGQGERLYPLTRDRSKPAVPFGSAYRIIDFTLSNCINSGLRQIYVLTQYKSYSLDKHLQRGWNIFNYGRIKNNVRAQDARLQGLLVNYQMIVTNQGPSTAENTVLYDRLPPGIVVTSAVAEAGDARDHAHGVAFPTGHALRHHHTRRFSAGHRPGSDGDDPTPENFPRISCKCLPSRKDVPQTTRWPSPL